MRSEPLLQPPHSVESEQSVLGGCMLDAAAVHQLGALRDADFYRSEHRAIFRAIQALAAESKPIDIVTVGEWMEARGTIDQAGGMPKLFAIAENTPGAANVATYAEIVRDRAQLRYALLALEDGRKMVMDRGARRAADILGDIQARLESIAGAGRDDAQSFAEVLSSALDAAKLARERRKAGRALGAPTGLPELDDRTGGIHGPRLWIVGGRPSLGKTALTLQWALHAAAVGYRVGIVSLEMGADELGARALACRFGLNAAALQHGDRQEYERLQELVVQPDLQGFRQLGLLFDFASSTLGGIVSRITAWRRADRIDFAIVDHIGLVEADGYSSRVDQLGAISRTLKKLAMRLGVPIVAVSQLSRAVEKERRRPSLSDLRDSGNLEQDADVVVMLHGQDDSGSTIEIGLLKNRAGVKGWLPTDYRFDGRCQRFTETPRDRYDDGE